VNQIWDIVWKNVVCLELLRRNKGEIWIGTTGQQEIDFVVQKLDGSREYYQIAYRVDSQPETLSRELEPLRKISDNYPKYLITTDLVEEQFEGVKKINVVNWLMKK